MKLFLQFFGIFFVLFFSVGFYNGRADVNEDKFLKKHFANEVSMVEHDQKVYLTYIEEGERLYLYDVDLDSLLLLDKEALLNLEEKYDENNILGFIGSSITTVSVSGFVGYKVKDIFSHSSKIKETWKSSKGKGRILGIILGSISGYSIGYWISTYWAIPESKSKSVSKMFRDVSFWKFAEKWAYNAEREALYVKNGKGNKASKEISLFLKQIKFDVSDSDLNLTSKDFLALRKYKIKKISHTLFLEKV